MAVNPKLAHMCMHLFTKQNLRLLAKVLVKTGMYISDILALISLLQAMRGVKLRR